MDERQSARMSKITNDDNPVWHRVLYSCTRMATVGVKGITYSDHIAIICSKHYGD